MAQVAFSLMCRVAPREPLLLSYVESAANSADRPARPLHLQALLQLPRLADTRGFVAGSMVGSLLAELAQELPERAEWVVPNCGLSPRLFSFHEVEAAKARDVMQRFHYLRSPRLNGRAYGLSTSAG